MTCLVLSEGDPRSVLEKPPRMGGVEKIAQCRVSLLHQVLPCMSGGHGGVPASLISAWFSSGGQGVPVEPHICSPCPQHSLMLLAGRCLTLARK